MNILLLFIGVLIGAFIALLRIAFDKTVVLLQSDETIIKKKDLEVLVKGYAFAAKKIEPDLYNELNEK